MFNALFNNTNSNRVILNVRVIGCFADVYKHCLKLKRFKEKLFIIGKHNEQSEQKKVLTIKNKKVDAEDYYL